MYSDYKKEQGTEILQTNGKEKHGNSKESKIPQIKPSQKSNEHLDEPKADGEDKHSKRLPKRKFVTTLHRRLYYETRGKKKNR